MSNCESCGMKIDEGKYCDYCAPNGALLSREDVKKNWIDFSISEGMTLEDAEKKVSEQMSTLSAWKE